MSFYSLKDGIYYCYMPGGTMKSKSIGSVFLSILMFAVLMLQAASANTGRVFSVTRVAPDDVLNVRSSPGVGSYVLGDIPANGEGVVALGETQQINNSEWVRVAWGALNGWVNGRYLEPIEVLPQSQSSSVFSRDMPKAATLECGGIKPFWNIDVTHQYMDINIKDDQRVMALVDERKVADMRERVASITARERGDIVELFLVKTMRCQDGITDIEYPYSVKAVINGNHTFMGCCNIVQ
jgi:uncharacterized membrane protein